MIPSGFCIYITIWGCKNAEDLNTTAKYLLTFFYSLSIFICLWSLFQVTFTEPGILPSISMNTKIQNIDIKKPNQNKEYYVEYQNKQELHVTMAGLDITDPVDKYFNLKKYKYLPLLYQD